MALHPFIIAMLDQTKDMPALSAGTPEEGRELVASGRARLGNGPDLALRQDLKVPGQGRDIPVRLLLPKTGAAGVIVFIHGGGWVIGALDDYDTYMATLADRSGFAVLGIDYRLAPEHPFPAGLDDCEAVLSYVINRKIPNIPGGPIVIAGDSAGANLATACCARLADRSPIALQVLYYPVTDCDFDRASYRAHGTGLPLSAQDMGWFFGHYAPKAQWADPAISVLRRTDLANMPPAVVVTAEYDVLCDEGEEYARRLHAAAVPVTLRRVAGVTHGFIRLHNLFDVADKELSTISQDICNAADA